MLGSLSDDDSQAGNPELGRVSGIGSRAGRIQWTPTYGLLAALIVLLAVYALTVDFFFTGRNLLNVARAISINGIVGLALSGLMITGSVDLSVASLMSLAGVVTGLGVMAGWPFWLAACVALVVGAAAGAIHGILVNGLGLNSIIVTLGALFTWEGVAFLLSRGEPLVTDAVWSYLGQGRLFGIVPVPFLILVLVFGLVYYVLHIARVGNWLYAIGGNREATRLAGIPVARLSVILFVGTGAIAAFGGVVLAGSAGAVLPYAAQGLEFPILGAVILGGTSLHGGRGGPVGTLVALVFLGILFNGMTLMGIAPAWQLVMQGIVIVFAVAADAIRERAIRGKDA